MNWKTKFRNKAWILTLVSSILVALQLILAPFDIKIDNNYVMAVTNAVLSVLGILGVVMNPNTKGIKD